MKHNSADYIELSISNNDENDDPPDHDQHDERTYEKEENYKPTTALLNDVEQDNNSDNFILYENDEPKSKPKHETTLAIQVK